MAKVFSVAFICCMIAGASAASGKQISQHIAAAKMNNMTDTMPGLGDFGLGDVRHTCGYANPCTMSVSPSYKQWDYLVVNSTHGGTSVNAGTTVNMLLVNGDADITIGPRPHVYWSNCCGSTKKGKCLWKDTESQRYSGSCGHGGMVISVWNHNLVTDLIVNLIFMNEAGIPLCTSCGPA